ncbi:MAG: VOC family protein [Bacillota bacterium]|nr:VOC family protein [Bacillota bacterium]
MKFLHVTIQTNQFEKEIEFYEKEVGLTIQRDMRPKKDLVFLANGSGETCVEVIRADEADTSGNPHLSIGFQAEDVTAKHEEMAAAGYQVTPMISPMPGVQFFFVTDPAGVNVQFI